MSDFYQAPVQKEARSTMNVVWRLPSEALDDKFVAEAKKAGMVGLKGHRAVGGIRASTYNAVTVDNVTPLADGLVTVNVYATVSPASRRPLPSVSLVVPALSSVSTGTKSTVVEPGGFTPSGVTFVALLT